MAGLAAAQRPKAPSTCAQAPWSWATALAAARSSNAPLFTLPAWRQTIVGPAGPAASTRARSVDVDRALVVGRHRLDDVGAQAEEAQGAVDRGVALAVGHHAHRRASGEAAALDVPAHGGEHVVAGRGEGHGVGGLAAGHESERRLGGEPEQVLEPATGDVLDHRGCRAR